MTKKAAALFINEAFAPLLERMQFTPEWVFGSSQIRVWRRLPDRENCTLEFVGNDEKPLKFHVKRYPRKYAPVAAQEARAFFALSRAGIGCPRVVAYGRSRGRGFLITEDLRGYEPADKLIERGQPFEPLLHLTAELAARLHKSGYHHQDLYLCHFFVGTDAGEMDINLIDAARVRRLPRWPFKRRWIVKDLAQFWYSSTRLAITDEQRLRWLLRYAECAGQKLSGSLRRAIDAKVNRIGRHDVKLNQRQPTRHRSIPG